MTRARTHSLRALFLASKLVDITGRRYAAPTDYPQFFWGFFSVALAWQCVFLLIGTNPARFRP